MERDDCVSAISERGERTVSERFRLVQGRHTLPISLHANISDAQPSMGYISCHVAQVLSSCSFTSPPGGDSYRRSGRESYRDGYRESYRDNYRDSYRDRERGRYGGAYDAPREYDRYGGSSRNYGGEYYDRTFDRGYDRAGGGYDRYDDRYRGYDKAYERYDGYYEDYGRGGRYSDYRARSRSPPRDYYGGGRERG